MTVAAVIAALALSAPVAQGHWQHLGVQPPCGQPRAVVMTIAALNADRARAASANHLEPTGADADADEATCVMRFAADAVASRVDACDLLVHETGHLYRLRWSGADIFHDPRRRSVMNANPYPTVACMRAFMPWRVRYLTQHGYVCRTWLEMVAWVCVRPGAWSQLIDAT